MLISRESLTDLVDTPLDKGQVLRRLHRYYCKPMSIMGKCTAICVECKPHLSDIFAPQKGDIRNPYALLTWRIRNQVAEIAEIKEVTPQRKDWLGQPIKTNPFLAVLEEL
jgi:hypothetical protein